MGSRRTSALRQGLHLLGQGFKGLAVSPGQTVACVLSLEPSGLFVRMVSALIFLVLQTFLWVGSTLSRMVFKEGMRWKAWNCIGNCLG